LDLRGNRISVVENLGATEDQFDVIDLSDNAIIKLEGFPLLKRLTTLLLSNNYIRTVGDGLGNSLPNLEYLILTNNRIADLSDLDSLEELNNIRILSLFKNPVVIKKHYRLYLINKLPKLQILDFRKISPKEREDAKELFGGEVGEQLKSEISRTKAIATGALKKGIFTSEQEILIEKAISNLGSREDALKLEQILTSGKLPPNFEEKFGIKVDEENNNNETN